MDTDAYLSIIYLSFIIGKDNLLMFKLLCITINVRLAPRWEIQNMENASIHSKNAYCARSCPGCSVGHADTSGAPASWAAQH